MATVLAISSQVARGSVGLSLITPALQAIGHRVIALPTILLSNHPGYGASAGQRIEPALLARMRDAMSGHGWLAEIDCVLSGYLPSAEHAAFVADTIGMVRKARAGCRYICDPVIGDDPKGIYIDPKAAEAIRDILLPLADVTTPNRFELAWLAGKPVTTPAEASTAAHAIGVAQVIATSIPAGSGRIATMCADDVGAFACEVERRDNVPKGTGDLVGALVAAGWDLGRIAAALDAAIAANSASMEIDLAAAERSWMTVEPFEAGRVDAG